MGEIQVYNNPSAGGCRGRETSRRALDRLHALGWNGTVRDVREGFLSARGSERVLLIGGDGTLHRALPELLQYGLPLGLIPAGTGNDFARSLGLPLDPESAAEVALSAPLRSMDVGMANSHPYLGIACFGLDAEVAERTRLGKQSRWSYVFASLSTLAGYHPREVQVTWDGGSFTGPVTLVAAANSSRYGNNMILAPEAELSDGYLDLVLVKSLPKWALLRLFAGLASGRTPAHPAILRARTKNVVIEGSPYDTLSLFADGEPVSPLPVRITVQSGLLKVAAP